MGVPLVNCEAYIHVTWPNTGCGMKLCLAALTADCVSWDVTCPVIPLPAHKIRLLFRAQAVELWAFTGNHSISAWKHAAGYYLRHQLQILLS